MVDPSALVDGARAVYGREVADRDYGELVPVPQERIVISSMLVGGWRPGTPWMPFTAIITLADEGEGTRSIAQVMHPDQATRDRLEGLGFFDGWNTCITQLETFAQTLGG